MEKTEKYIQEWMPKNEILLPYYDGINSFLIENLSKSLKNESENLQSKIIADPLLGYIHLTNLEVSIIDTKLFQRLRKIKQLGLAHYVFPSLGYSRFEHSIGVLGRLNQILIKLVENHEKGNFDFELKKTIDKHIVSIRLAALLHDIGHCLFSHCSERVINNLGGTNTYPSSNIIREEFSKHFNKDKLIPFAEIFAVSLIGSKYFLEFFLSLELFNKKECKKILENCSKFILGLPVENEPDTVFLSQLISSGLDADKIDYMLREQLYTGIKLEIDIDRILSKLNVFDLHSFELPSNLNYLKKQFDTDKKFKVLGFSKGGQFVFEEFCIARLALHVKVYLHQKIRASESQLANYLENISKNNSDLFEFELQKAHNWLLIPEYIVENPTILQNLFNNADALFNNSPILKKDQIDALINIDERNIYSRAFAFGQINSFSESLENEINENFENYFEIFIEDSLNQMIKEEIKIIKSTLSLNIEEKILSKYIIDIPKLRFKSIQQGQESLYFERPPLSPLKWTIPLDKIVVYFEENRALGYVFAEKEIAAIIGLASEKAVFELTKKVFSQEGNISKNTFLKMNEYKKELTQKRYYLKYPELKDISDYLKKADAGEKIKKIHEKFATFKSFTHERITINKITTFVNQFPINLQEVCLEFLNQLEILDSRLLETEINRVLLKYSNETEKQIGISYLGGVADSAGRLSYDLREIFESNNLEPKELNDTLIMKSDVLIIYDDNINSGLQLLNIMAELLGELGSLPANLNLNEKHISSLVTDEAKDRIKKIPIHFCYSVGQEKTEENIKNLLVEYLNFNTDNINFHINHLLKDNEKVFNGRDSKFNHKDKLEFKEYISNIGKQLLKNENKSTEKIESCHLGYANAEATILFPYNIPTMTITAIWLKGFISEKDDKIPWIPLAERRRRRDKKGEVIGED